MTIIRQITDGDTLVSESIMEGIHLGECLEMKPTDKKSCGCQELILITSLTGKMLTMVGLLILSMPCLKHE